MSGPSPGVVVVLAEGGEELARWPLEPDTPIDLGTIEDLARMVLTARRLGRSLHVVSPCPDLVALARLSGLEATLGT